jgi:predicted metal-dependent hydrolase
MHTVTIPPITAPIHIARRRGTRKIRITIKHDGIVRLTVPYGISQSQAEQFLLQKAEWVNSHAKPRPQLEHGQHFGKSHRLYFEPHDRQVIASRVNTTDILIRYPAGMAPNDPAVQQKAREAVKKALIKEAEHLLPVRLDDLSERYSLPYASVRIRTLQTRWGSCDSHNNIVLNAYLIQLDWPLIDYVITHELSHTVHQHHQADFWDYLERLMPGYKQHRKELKERHTDIVPTFL